MERSYATLKRLKEKNGEVEFQAEIPEAVMEKHLSAELGRAGHDLTIAGFRKGKVPEHIVREYVDQQELLRNAADDALNAAVREIIKDEALSILGRPELTITKIEPKHPVEFKVRFALFPKVALPDYKAIGKAISERKDAVEVADKELQDAIERLLGMMQVEPLPELTDELVKNFGNFKDVADFKAALKVQLAQEKELAQKEAKREEIMGEIVKQAKVSVPDLLIDQEWQAFTEERDMDLERAGLSLEEYLKQTKKDEKTLEKDERALIEKQIMTSLVFREIQKQEDIMADDKEIHANMAYLKSRYPDRDNASLHQTAEAVIVQEKVFDLLGAGMEEAKAEEETVKA